MIANDIIMYIVVGTTAENPAVSCASILAADPAAQSGEYFLRSASAAPSDPSTSVFCDMTLDCDGVVGGWRQLADLSPDTGCPGGFREFFGICNSLLTDSIRFHSNVGPGCQLSLPFPVNGIEYSQVCGRISGFHGGSVGGFGVSGASDTVDGLYVEGVSVTYGPPPRTHIWSFALTVSECPCAASGMSAQPPSFVGTNYFCEVFDSGIDDSYWDGEDCLGADACSCTADQGNGPPFFLRTFDSPVAEDIEARFCADAVTDFIGFSILQLYVR